MNFIKKYSLSIAALLLLGFTLLGIHLAWADSLTYDERAHIPAAYSYVRYGDIRLNPEHPPILKDLAGIPLLFLNLEFPLASSEWQNGPNEQWAVGSKFISCTVPEEACNDARTVSFWARLPLILIATLLAGFLFWWTRKVAGPLAGLLALSFMVFDPNVIAHSHLVTTDVGIAAFLFFAFYFFIKFLKHPSWKNTFLVALFFTIVQLVKFSAILLLPVFGLFLLLYALAKPLPENTSSRVRARLSILAQYLGKALLVFLFYAVVVWVTYYLHTLNTPSSHLDATAKMMFTDEKFGPVATSIVERTSQGTLTKPYSAYLLGLMMVFGRVAGGNTYYFLGSVQKTAEPSYFPIVFLTKETLPFLSFLCISLFYSLLKIAQGLRKKYQEKESWRTTLSKLLLRHLDSAIIVFFILFYSVLSITGNLNIGFRHLFPIIPFLYLLVAKTSVRILKDTRIPLAHRTSLGYLFGILILIQLSIPFFSYPSYLSYYNEFAGGTERGNLVAVDSNYDWGQDLFRLKSFIAHHNYCATTKTVASTFSCDTYLPHLPPINKIRVEYFGGSNAQQELSGVFEKWSSELPEESGWYALSLNPLQENWVSSAAQREHLSTKNYLWLLNYEPVAKAGTSILIYYIPE
jgi:4-amino-4-deoxy-L-arabinose transferase-like glycosyltransferase